ncbi:expressed protein, partial [Phakopsora pachyrhizi]
MDRQCDCDKCVVKYGNKGPLVSAQTSKAHYQKISTIKQTKKTIEENLLIEKRNVEQPNINEEPFHKIQIQNSSPSQLFNETIKKDPGNWLFLSIAFVTFLYVVGNLSQDLASSTLFIIKLIVEEVTLSNQTSQSTFKLLQIFPVDVCTAIGWLGVEPELKRSICCPRFFKKYPCPKEQPKLTHC